ncbi:TPA: hypothetical protein DD449_03785 [Candidatus Berkelbacteria bacterium]|uniref:Uncharacterized protein n=1 Tax=Berkelbacteria bacterium GW2011_GWE1_39_12 TaxID=1618337 RepID=A0A0G4B2S4_9BACT|nr:MAG: hypothetical protein UT28_C0001G0393 [Berkelbacteria bacterium GW2011_GWE1_39_12]HBO60777.1 hypothetical protein [Candidatus Berkelbacteria bacterium]
MNQSFEKIIFDRALNRHPEFWSEKKEDLTKTITEIIDEISGFEAVDFDSISKDEAENILAIWCISGSGSLTSDFIDSPSDDKYKDKKWYGGTDRIRLRFSEKIFLAIDKKKSRNLFLIYNGIPEQVVTLLQEAGKSFTVLKQQIYVPDGEIVKTLDQVEKFSLPPALKKKSGDLVIVSHAAHLSRILRFMKKHEKLFEGLTIRPLAARVDNSSDFVEAELSGILDYVATGQASDKPIDFESF